MARNAPPAGAEIAEQAKRHVFDQAKSVRATRDSDKVDILFTPTQFANHPKKDEVEGGIVLGQIDLDVGQYQGQHKASLHTGKHHLYMAKVGDTWKAYAESDGNIAVEATRVAVKEESASRDISNLMPKVTFGSVCFTFCITVMIPIPIAPWEIPVPYCWTACL